MCLNLNDSWFKTTIDRQTDMNFMVTTKKNPTIDQKTKRKEPKHNTIENHQTTREEIKRRTEKNHKITRK